MMIVKRKSPISGKETTMDLDITHEQIARFNDGDLVQEAFPNLSAAEREFILTGISPAEWEAVFPKGEEE